MPVAYTYRVTAASTGCTRYTVGQEITLWYNEGEAPESATLHYDAPCQSVSVVIVPDDA